MNLYYEKQGLELHLDEGLCNCLCIENPHILREFSYNIWKQSEGNEGDICVSLSGRPVNLAKESSVVFNPYSLGMNEKKILSKIYTEMRDIGQNELYEQYSELNGKLVSYVDELSQHIPYPIDYSLDMDLIQLFKLMNVKVEETEQGLAERMTSYFRLAHQTMNTILFVLFYPGEYLDSLELKMISEMLELEHVFALAIERSDRHLFYKNRHFNLNSFLH